MNKKFYSSISGTIYPILSILSFIGVIETVIVMGFRVQHIEILALLGTTLYLTIIILYLLWVASSLVESRWDFRSHIIDLVLAGLLVGLVFPVTVGGIIISFRIAGAYFFRFMRTGGVAALFSQLGSNPAKLLLFTFLGGIAAGTLLLMMPASTADGRGAPLFDAFFTATSATCVTGLIVRDTGTYFSGFGQTVIILLVQMGGLGIMTFSTLFALLLGRKLGLKHEEQMMNILDQPGYHQMYDLILQILKITLFLEGMGALLLYLRWAPVMGQADSIKNAAFHSVSAFCNAGFSLFPDSFIAYSGDLLINFVIITLVVFGGLGFVVVNDLLKNRNGLNPFKIDWLRLSIHSRVVLIISGALLAFGTLAIFFFEYDGTLLGLSIPEKLLASFFQSTMMRTAGFNTLDISLFKDVSLFIMMPLMFIGASPASTGGGIKTTTFFILIISVWSLLRSRDKVELFRRTISPQLVYRSIAIVLFSLTFLVIFTILLLATQTGTFIDILFESFSALGTVGLSTGVTPDLTNSGKIFISILMYVGRVGPLSVALALGEVKKVNVEYPTARMIVG